MYRRESSCYRFGSGKQWVENDIARWHQHINFCKAPAGQKAAYFGPDAKFGMDHSAMPGMKMDWLFSFT
jgi:hypothetical protein